MTITDRVERYVGAGDVPGGTLVDVWVNSATGAVENRTTSPVNPATGNPTSVTAALVAINDSARDMPLRLLDTTTGQVRQTLTLPALTLFTRTAAQLAAVGISTRTQAAAMELSNA
jgi:hypothetical protein